MIRINRTVSKCSALVVLVLHYYDAWRQQDFQWCMGRWVGGWGGGGTIHSVKPRTVPIVFLAGVSLTNSTIHEVPHMF